MGLQGSIRSEKCVILLKTLFLGVDKFCHKITGMFEFEYLGLLLEGKDSGVIA